MTEWKSHTTANKSAARQSDQSYTIVSPLIPGRGGLAWRKGVMIDPDR